jgi:hypothetical protein
MEEKLCNKYFELNRCNRSGSRQTKGAIGYIGLYETKVKQLAISYDQGKLY